MVRMSAPDAASLRSVERELLERLVAALERELGQELRAVWLYGSAARGEARSEGSDVDVLVVAEDCSRAEAAVAELMPRIGGDYRWESVFSVHVVDPDWLAHQRAIEGFFIGEVERDKIVLAGDALDDLPREAALEPRGRMKERSGEMLATGREALKAAELLLAEGLYGPALRSGYDALLAAARAALSEEDLYAKTHAGIWNLFYERLVLPGHFAREFHTVAAHGHTKRLDDLYEGRHASAGDAIEMVDSARRLIDAVVERLD